MPNILKSVTAYPANGNDFNTIYTAPAGTGVVVQNIIESYSGLNIGNRGGQIQSNSQNLFAQEATVAIKRAGKSQPDIIAAAGILPNTSNKKNASVIPDKLILNAGDSIVANCSGNSPIRPIFNPKKIVADQTDQVDRNNIPCLLMLSNTDGSVIICYSQGVVFRSTDRGKTWIRKVIHSNTSVSGFGMYFKGEFFLYTTLNNGVSYRSTDGDTWTLFSATVPSTFIYNNVTPGGITVDGTTAAYVCTTGLFHRTLDGVTWSSVTVSENTNGSCVAIATADHYILIRSADASTPIKSYWKSNGNAAYNYTLGTNSTAVKVYRVANLIFVILSASGGYYTVYFSLDMTTVPFTLLGGSSQTTVAFIPLKDAFIWRSGEKYILQRIINGVYFDEAIELNTNLFIDGLTGTHVFDTSSGGIQRIVTTTNGPVIASSKGMIFDTADANNTACFGTSLTVSVIETSE